MEKKQPSSSHKSDKEMKSLVREGREEEAGCSSTTREPKSNLNSSLPSSSSKTPEASTAEPAQSSTGRNSPDPCCAICLEPLQNKSFTNSCLHMFCFKCLVQWSKVKPECPLCKQRFISIIHNVQEDFQYDTYYIKNRATESFWNFETPTQALSVRINASVSRPRFRYRTTLTTDRSATDTTETNSLRVLFENHRRRFAPHSVSVVSTTPSVNHPLSTYRRNIYRTNMWVKPLQANRFRITSPDFFRQNPACTHRLLPWLNRELRVLLFSFESQIVNVLELIMSLITRYEITSQEFYNQLLPYLHIQTRHFIHEFYYFAASPHDMETYDRIVEYERRLPNAVATKPSNEVIVIDNDDDSTPDSSQPGTSKDTSKAKTQSAKSKARKFIDKMVIKRNPETDSWVTVMSPLPLIHNYTNADYYNCAPSTSGIGINSFENSFVPMNRSTLISPIDTVVSSDEDDIEIVETVKPRSERTPEIIDLSSDEEPAIPVIRVSEDEDNSIDVVHVASSSSSDKACISSNSIYRSPISAGFSPISSFDVLSPFHSYSPSSHVNRVFNNKLLYPLSYLPTRPDSPTSLSHSSFSPVCEPASPIYSTEYAPTYTPTHSISSGHYSPISPDYSPVLPTYSPLSIVTSDNSNHDSSSTIECIYDSKASNPKSGSPEDNFSSLYPRLPSVISPASLDGLNPIDLSTKKSKTSSTCTNGRAEDRRKQKHFTKDNVCSTSDDRPSTSFKSEPQSDNELLRNKQSVQSKVIVPSSNRMIKRESSSWRCSEPAKRKSFYVVSSSDSEEVEFPKKALSSFIGDSRSQDKKHSKHHSSKKKHKSKKKKKKHSKDKYLSDSSS